MISSLNIKINLGWFYGIFILSLLVGSSNAVNLSDGLDGLAGGLCSIAFLSFGIIAWGTPWLLDIKNGNILFCISWIFTWILSI